MHLAHSGQPEVQTVRFVQPNQVLLTGVRPQTALSRPKQQFQAVVSPPAMEMVSWLVPLPRFEAGSGDEL